MASSEKVMIEVEAKVRVTDRKALGIALKQANAELRGTSKQRDTYFRHPVRDFATTDEALRLREADGKVTLTYKGPKLSGRTKSRVERSVSASDAEALIGILKAVGFEPVALVVKRRERYVCDGMEVAVDDVDGVGVYAEIEAVVEQRDHEAASERVMALAHRLGLETIEPRSYLEMLLEGEGQA